MRYDTILASLEQGVFPSFGRRFSVEDDGGYFSGNRIRGTHVFLSLSLLVYMYIYAHFYVPFTFVFLFKEIIW